MSSTPVLSPRERRNLLLHNLRIRLRLRPGRRLTVEEVPEGLRVDDGDCAIVVPVAKRLWRYRVGVAARHAQIASSYGALSHFGLERGAIVIDVGANVGEFALWAAARGARVLAIDPDPRVFACLARNARDTDVEAVRALLWHEEADLDFFSEPSNADSSIFGADGGAEAKTIRTRATTLDAVCAARGIGPVDVLKCDAEGAEPEVLKGASRVLTRTRVVAIDTGSEREGERTDAACGAILREAGFAVSDLTLDGRQITLGHRAPDEAS